MNPGVMLPVQLTQLGHVDETLDAGLLQLLQLLRSQPAQLHLALGRVGVALLIWLVTRDCCRSRVRAQILGQTRARGCVLFVSFARWARRALVDDTLVEVLDAALLRGKHGMIVVVVS